MRRALLACLFFLPLSTRAANRVIIAGGGDLSDFSMDIPSEIQEPKQGYLLGYNIMVGFQHPLSPNSAIVIGLGQETRGAVLKRSLPYPSEMAQGTVKLNYFHIPLLLKFYAPGSGTKAFFSPGMELALLGNAVSESIYSDRPQHLDAAGTVDVDLGATAGVEIPWEGYGFSIEAGYAYGLLNADTSDDRISIHNSNFKIRFGFFVGS